MVKGSFILYRIFEKNGNRDCTRTCEIGTNPIISSTIVEN